MTDVKVPWETRLGAVGANAISKRLSYFSTVTKVPHEADVGIDFLCELLRNDAPWQRFCVQAKGTEHFNEQWEGSIKRSTVLYWLRQEDPVFVIVYDEKNGNCYWMSIEDHRYDLLDRAIKRDPRSEKMYIKIDKSHLLQDGKNRNTDFEGKIIADKHSIEQFWGRPRMLGEGYVKRMPIPLRSAHEVRLTKENVRIYLSALIFHHIQQGDLDSACLCCEFLTRFDDEHYNHFEWFGLLLMDRRDFQGAIQLFSKAKSIFERDKNWPIRDKENNISRLNGWIDKCQQLENEKSRPSKNERQVTFWRRMCGMATGISLNDVYGSHRPLEHDYDKWYDYGRHKEEIGRFGDICSLARVQSDMDYSIIRAPACCPLSRDD